MIQKILFPVDFSPSCVAMAANVARAAAIFGAEVTIVYVCDLIIIAYELIWAIETGETATPQIAADAHRLIRARAKCHFGADAANNVRILYGGSVRPDNAKGLMAQPEIDGFLIGAASLDPASFASIVNL